MASPRKPAKQSSGWGGFLQQAVASVESRLDNILAEEDDRPAKAANTVPSTKENVSSAKKSENLSRSNSGTKTNDRLQERLAKAMVKSKSGSRPGSPAPAGSSISRAGTPLKGLEADSVQKTLTSGSIEYNATAQPSPGVERAALVDDGKLKLPGYLLGNEVANDTPSRPETEADLSTAGSGRTSMDQSGFLGPEQAPLLNSEVSDTNKILLNTSEDIPKENATDSLWQETEQEAADRRLQEEIHPYIERIDTLQAKLQYLAKEAAESAQQAAAAAKDGSAEKKILERDQKIALLMEEGQKLSKTEINHLAIIKKLRSQASTLEKEQFRLKLRADTAEKSLKTMEQRALRAEKAAQSTSAEDRELETVKRERSVLSATIVEMKSDLARMTARAETAEKKAQLDVSEQLRKQNEELRDDLTSARIERELAEEKLRREIKDLNSSLAREKEKLIAMETEMLGEQAALEAKLEAMRSRAEEVSSDGQGDTQAKLLRQIETLQTQYTAASQNWHGIEGSLLTRLASVEKERDEATKREGELRKKFRELNLGAKKMNQEQDENKEKIQELERLVADLKGEQQMLTRKAQQSEEQLSIARKKLEDQQERMTKEFSIRLEEEKAKWTASQSILRAGSPVTSLRKNSGFDFGLFMSPTDGRRPSVLPASISESNTPPRMNPSPSIRNYINGGVPEASSVHSVDQDEYFNVPPTPASPAQTHRGVNDLISTSTVGAGPSVQLVERMSASVRRLETEKAAAKDELARLTAQRDEARQEVISLMREVESKRAADERIKVLEEEQQKINERYHTTLELLGEKSELVEELKADVEDVKQMYRDLVESTMK